MAKMADKNIKNISRKYESEDISYFYGHTVEATRRELKRILGKESRIGKDQCEFMSSSVEWWKQLDDIPFKLYDYWSGGVDDDDDKDTMIEWRIGVGWEKREDGNRVRDYLYEKLSNERV